MFYPHQNRFSAIEYTATCISPSSGARPSYAFPFWTNNTLHFVSIWCDSYSYFIQISFLKNSAAYILHLTSLGTSRTASTLQLDKGFIFTAKTVNCFYLQMQERSLVLALDHQKFQHRRYSCGKSGNRRTQIKVTSKVIRAVTRKPNHATVYLRAGGSNTQRCTTNTTQRNNFVKN